MEVVYYLARAVAIGLGLFSIVLHEVAHAFVAFRLGDPTGAQQGRLTLNPLKHIDPIMTLVVPFATWYASQGRALFGGAKPVPVNPFLFRNMRKGMMLTAIAGPATNLLIALTFALLFRAPGPSWLLRMIFARVGVWNLILVVFNLVPVPPLDGSRVVSYFLPRDVAARYEAIGQVGMVIVMMLVFTGALSPVFLAAVHAYAYVAGSDVWTFL